jgi:hypothetical protein
MHGRAIVQCHRAGRRVGVAIHPNRSHFIMCAQACMQALYASLCMANVVHCRRERLLPRVVVCGGCHGATPTHTAAARMQCSQVPQKNQTVEFFVTLLRFRSERSCSVFAAAAIKLCECPTFRAPHARESTPPLTNTAPWAINYL